MCLSHITAVASLCATKLVDYSVGSCFCEFVHMVPLLCGFQMAVCAWPSLMLVYERDLCRNAIRCWWLSASSRSGSLPPCLIALYSSALMSVHSLPTHHHHLLSANDSSRHVRTRGTHCIGGGGGGGGGGGQRVIYVCGHNDWFPKRYRTNIFMHRYASSD